MGSAPLTELWASGDRSSLALLALVSALAVLALVLRIRVRRVRKWQLILEEPSSSVAFLTTGLKNPPKWIRDLPKGLKLDTEVPLFEILYQYDRSQATSFNPHVLSLTLAHLESPKGTDPALPKPTLAGPLSQEDKIRALIGARADAPGLLPTDALAENVVLNLVTVLKGKKRLTVGLEHALLDSLGAAGGIAGSKVGGAVGLASATLLTGVSLPLVPVLAVLGAWLGSMAGKRAGSWFKDWRHFSALKQLRLASRSFKKWFLAQFPQFLAARDEDFRAAIQQTRDQARRHQGLLLRFLFPSLMTSYFKASLARLEHDRRAERRRLRRLHDLIRSLDSTEFATILGTLDESSAAAHPQLLEHYRAYRSAHEALQSSRKAAA
jgi:hypothetical protein